MRGTISLAISLAAAAALAGCGTKKDKDKKAAASSSGLDAAAAPPRTIDVTRQDLGAVSPEAVTAPESRPALAMLGEAPVVAYRRGTKAAVARWDGTTWMPITGEPPCDDVESLAIAPDGKGELVLVGVEAGGGNCAGRTQSGSWVDTGVALANPAFRVKDARVVATARGPVAVLHHAGDQGDLLVLVHWDGAAWKEIAQAPVGAGQRVTSFDAAGSGDDVALAWIERVPQQPATAGVQWFSLATAEWKPLPPIEQIDGDTSLRLAAHGSVLLVARTWNPGMKEVLRLAPAAKAWASLGLPVGQRAFTAHGQPVIAAGRRGEAVLAWAGPMIEVAMHDSRWWSDLVTDLGRKPDAQSELQIATSATGAIGLVWREAGAGETPRVRAAVIIPAPAK